MVERHSSNVSSHTFVWKCDQQHRDNVETLLLFTSSKGNCKLSAQTQRGGSSSRSHRVWTRPDRHGRHLNHVCHSPTSHPREAQGKTPVLLGVVQAVHDPRTHCLRSRCNTALQAFIAAADRNLRPRDPQVRAVLWRLQMKSWGQLSDSMRLPPTSGVDGHDRQTYSRLHPSIVDTRASRITNQNSNILPMKPGMSRGTKLLVAAGPFLQMSPRARWRLSLLNVQATERGIAPLDQWRPEHSYAGAPNAPLERFVETNNSVAYYEQPGISASAKRFDTVPVVHCLWKLQHMGVPPVVTSCLSSRHVSTFSSSDARARAGSLLSRTHSQYRWVSDRDVHVWMLVSHIVHQRPLDGVAPSQSPGLPRDHNPQPRTHVRRTMLAVFAGR
ncbi:hypothetical protein BASA60_005157 [Batrachochytrium salamandrivorans]|nr:hypothetical protein BASA60_005157 [Batrachochytrium salamandrivorans]